MRRLTRSIRGAPTKILRTAALALVYSNAEYHAPAWCRSNHTRLIDKPINDALRTVTGYLRPISTDNLPVLARIKSADVRRKKTTIALARRAKEQNHLLHYRLRSRLIKQQSYLKSRRPFVTTALKLLQDLPEQDATANLWLDHKWNSEWQESPSQLCNCLKDVSNISQGITLPKQASVKRSGLRIGVGYFRAIMRK